MFDYNKFKAVSYRYKYETALETQSERISFGQLLDMIDAVYNSIYVSNPSGGNVAVLLRCCPEAICTYFACSKAGFECISADSMISEQEADRLAGLYNPTVVVMPSDQMARLSGVFQKNGCKIAVYTGSEPQTQYFPAQFGFDVLLDKNNYSIVEKKHVVKACEHVFYYGSNYNDKLPAEVFELGQRQSVYIGLPVYEQAGASLLCGLLYSGHRCFISQQPDIKLLKRKKVWAVVCDKLSVQLYEETVKCKVFAVDTDVSKKFVYAGGGILYPDCVSDDLSGLTGLHVSCKFDGKKIRIVTETNKTPDPSDELVKLISKRCNELLYGLDVPKSLVFVVKTV